MPRDVLEDKISTSEFTKSNLTGAYNKPLCTSLIRARLPLFLCVKVIVNFTQIRTIQSDFKSRLKVI